MCICMLQCGHGYVHTNVCVYVCACVCLSMCIAKCMYEYVCVQVHVCAYM